MKQLGIIILLIRSSYLIIWPHHTLSINSFKIDLKYLPVSFEEAPGLPCSSYEEHKKSGNWLYHPKVISVSRYSLILKSLFLNHEGAIGVHFTPRFKFFFYLHWRNCVVLLQKGKFCTLLKNVALLWFHASLLANAYNMERWYIQVEVEVNGILNGWYYSRWRWMVCWMDGITLGGGGWYADWMVLL